MLGLSDYNALRAMKGWPAVTLAPGTCLFHCRDYLAQALTDYHQPISVAGQRLTPAEVQTGELNQDLWDANGHGFVIVVPGPAGGGAAGEPQCSGCHDGTAGDGGAVCRVMYHP